MRKPSIGHIVAGLAALLAAGPVHAQSAKHTVQVADTVLLRGGAADGWVDILSGSIHTASWKDLIIGVSLEAGLFTSTTVRSRGGNNDTSKAEASIQVRVLVDGVEVFPGAVTFARRHQELMAKFGGIVESCSDLDGDGTIVVETECVVTDEELRLVLDTMNANAFNFVLPDLRSGDHSIVVQARIDTSTSAESGEAAANGVIGKGSLIVEEVRMVRGLDVTL